MKTKEAPIKKLSLKRETLRTLTPAELEGVAGGTGPTVWTITVATALSIVSTYVSYKVTTTIQHH